MTGNIEQSVELPVSCCGHKHTRHKASLLSSPLGTGVWLQLLAGQGAWRTPKISLSVDNEGEKGSSDLRLCCKESARLG